MVKTMAAKTLLALVPTVQKYWQAVQLLSNIMMMVQKTFLIHSAKLLILTLMGGLAQNQHPEMEH
jgi:hypothetical protein